MVAKYPASTHPALRNQVTIGCIIHSSTTIKEIKNKKIETTTFLKCLNKNQIYIETDSLRYEVTQVVGYLLKLHPNITHHDSMKELFAEYLYRTSITPDDVIALEDSTKEHYQQIMDSGEDSEAFVPLFKVFPTTISSRPNNDQISSCTLGIRTSSKYQNLLCKLLTCLFQTPAPEIAHIQFTLCGISTVIGLENYQKLILTNNKYLSIIATIPINGITSHTLDLNIQVAHLTNPNKQMSIRKIILSNDGKNHPCHIQTQTQQCLTMGQSMPSHHFH